MSTSYQDTVDLSRSHNKLSEPENDDEAYIVTQAMLKRMCKDSPFFQNNPSHKLPKFESSEINLDVCLGEGEFGSVYAVGCIQPCHHSSDRDSVTQAATETTQEDADDAAFWSNSPRLSISSKKIYVQIDLEDVDLKNITNSFGRPSLIHNSSTVEDADVSKEYMGLHALLDGQPQYAVKKIRQDLQGDDLIQATADLALEANFLMSLRHPNVCRMRGTVGEPGTPEFGIVMDRFVMTLEDKMVDWKKYEQKRHSLFKRVLRQHQPSKEAQFEVQRQIYGEKLMAIHDIARALRYLADKRIIFRDVKPANVGVDLYGDMRLFDFGLAKELKEQDMLAYDTYHLTQMVGSKRYMAPEVITSRDYGLSADVYSFAMLVWHVLSNTKPYSGMRSDNVFEMVVYKQKRPSLTKMVANPQVLPEGSGIFGLVNRCWSQEPRDRPRMEPVCDMIYAEIVLFNGADDASSTLTV